MNARINHQQLLRFAGLFTWGMVGIPLLYAGWQGFDPSGMSQGSVSGWIFSYLAFGVLYLLVTGHLNIYRRGWRDSVSLFLLTLIAIAVS